MLAYKTVYDMDSDGVDDRAYRIKKNMGQKRVDFLSMIGGASFGAWAAVFGGHNFRGVLARASLGCALGVAVHGLDMVLHEGVKQGYISMS